MLRGLAIALMFVFHFSYDLNYFGVVSIQFLQDPFWLNFRRLIVSLFLLLVGIILHLATRNGLRWRAWSRRLGLLLLYAGLVSLGSWMIFPETFLYFGFLHFIALASIIGLLFTRYYWFNLLLGSGLVILDINFSPVLFGAPYLRVVRPDDARAVNGGLCAAAALVRCRPGRHVYRHDPI